MKLLPDVFNDSFLDFFHDPLFNRSNNVMKTDIRELENGYELDMELPGYKKEDIHLELKDGYLNIQADRSTSKEEKDEQGNIVRQERYSGSCSRSFYLGEGISETEIKAKYDNGELKIMIPKKDASNIIEKKCIQID